ncbi:uncharacterized protein [Palaemon carinicauda]|uniref:uncharacterized protein n=1 Tax=Palaemon carinicauda TaxID=392227 RepID=UPI0035B65F7F
MKTLVVMAVMGLCSALPRQALHPFSSPSHDGHVQSTYSSGPLSAARNDFLDTHGRQFVVGSHADRYDPAPVYDSTLAHHSINGPARSISTHAHARPHTVHSPAHNLVHHTPVHSLPHTQARTTIHAHVPAHAPRQIHAPAHYDAHTPTRDIYLERSPAVAHTPSHHVTHAPAHSVQHARAHTFAHNPATHHISDGPSYIPTSRPSYEHGTIHHDSQEPSYSTVEPAHIVVSNGYVQDTPEVAAAKEKFFNLYNQQAAAAAAAPDDYDEYYNDEYGSY